MNQSIHLPGFSAAASLRRTRRAYAGKAARSPSGATIVPQRSALGGAGIATAGRLGFACAPWGCVCDGDSDCNDMFSTNACGPVAVCIGSTCFCGR